MQRLSGAGLYAGRTGGQEIAKIALHGDGSDTDIPAQQGMKLGRAFYRIVQRRSRLMLKVGWGTYRLAAGGRNRAKRADQRAKFAADAQALVELHGAINDADSTHRSDMQAGRVFAVATDNGRGLRGGTRQGKPRMLL